MASILRLLDRSPLLAHAICGRSAVGFDAAAYCRVYPDIGAARVDPLDHYIRAGWREGRDPGDLLTTIWYIWRYLKPINAWVCPLLHYAMEGRRKNVQPHPDEPCSVDWWSSVAADSFFNSSLRRYAEVYASVMSSGIFDAEYYVSKYNVPSSDALGYFLQTGWRQNHDPSRHFSTRLYQDQNPDVRAAGMNPLAHYALMGRAEGRKFPSLAASRPPASTTAATFSPVKPEGTDFVGNNQGTSLVGARTQILDYFVDGAASATSLAPAPLVNPRIIAFYLPQYHRIPENDAWWGSGFTEWTNVRKARPNFVGHDQPRRPQHEAYYDLSDPLTQVQQSALAKEFGLSAFCYYVYWFGGRRLLERPLDQMIATPAVDFPFCICWANENWTRTWDGRDDQILMAQDHSAESDFQFIVDMMKYLANSRYLRVDGKLVLLVYRADLMPDSRATTARWREEVERRGLGELHLCAIQFYGIGDPEKWGFDAAVEFPPHGWLERENLLDPTPSLVNQSFAGNIFDYAKCVDFALRKQWPPYRWYRGAFPGWDNTPRRQDTPDIFANSSTFQFERWMREILRQTVLLSPPEHQLVFVNAWNEWGEGAVLEPDETSGLHYLQALNSALENVRDQGFVLNIIEKLRDPACQDRADAERLLLNIVRGQERALRLLSSNARRI